MHWSGHLRGKRGRRLAMRADHRSASPASPNSSMCRCASSARSIGLGGRADHAARPPADRLRPLEPRRGRWRLGLRTRRHRDARPGHPAGARLLDAFRATSCSNTRDRRGLTYRAAAVDERGRHGRGAAGRHRPAMLPGARLAAVAACLARAAVDARPPRAAVGPRAGPDAAVGRIVCSCFNVGVNQLASAVAAGCTSRRGDRRSAARRHQLRLLPLRDQEHHRCRSYPGSRVRRAPPALAARRPAGLPRPQRQAGGGGRRHRGGRLEGRAARRRRRHVDVYAPAAILRRDGKPRSTEHRIVHHGHGWDPACLDGAAVAFADAETMTRQRRLRGRGACRRRACQRHRQAGFLPFPVRLHRQPLAGGGRHLDRRRRAHSRPGDPPPHRDAAAAFACRLGGAGAATVASRSSPRLACRARRRAFWETLVDRAFGPAPTASAEADLARIGDPPRPATLPPAAASPSSAPDPATRNC